MTDSTDSPVALVTGGSKRIGATISRMLHGRGFNIAIHFGQSRHEAELLAASLSGIRPDSADTFQADLTDLPSISAMAEAVVNRWSRIDAIVNNASTFYPTPIAYSDEAQWHDLLDSNLKGPFFLARELASHLRARRGSIVNITDINARQPLKDYPIYCIAKAGKTMLTRTLAKELAPEVRVNAVAPGSILWPEGKAEMSEEAKSSLLSKIPLQRIGTPESIAELVCFLITSASYITGQVIAVDGGLSLQGDTY